MVGKVCKFCCFVPVSIFTCTIIIIYFISCHLFQELSFYFPCVENNISWCHAQPQFVFINEFTTCRNITIFCNDTWLLPCSMPEDKLFLMTANNSVRRRVPFSPACIQVPPSVHTDVKFYSRNLSFSNIIIS